MHKSTTQQIILFIITSIVITKAGTYLFNLKDINSFIDFGVIALFFISFILFMNYLIRLSSKLLGF